MLKRQFEDVSKCHNEKLSGSIVAFMFLIKYDRKFKSRRDNTSDYFNETGQGRLLEFPGMQADVLGLDLLLEVCVGGLECVMCLVTAHCTVLRRELHGAGKHLTRSLAMQ